MTASPAQAARPSRQEYRLRRRELATKVLEAYAAGRSVSTIATELGITPNRAASLLGQALAKVPPQDAEAYRAAGEARLDRLAAEFGRLLDSDDERTRMQAAQGLLRVEAERTKLLGLNLLPERTRR